MMRFIVPLHEPGRHLVDRRRAETIAPQLDLPARGAQHLDARHFRRRRRGDAPARRADALRRCGLRAQQQRGDAALLRREREAAAGRRIGGAGLAQHGGDARRAQAFLHRPEEILLAARRHHQRGAPDRTRRRGRAHKAGHRRRSQAGGTTGLCPRRSGPACARRSPAPAPSCGATRPEGVGPASISCRAPVSRPPSGSSASISGRPSGTALRPARWAVWARSSRRTCSRRRGASWQRRSESPSGKWRAFAPSIQAVYAVGDRLFSICSNHANGKSQRESGTVRLAQRLLSLTP